MIPDEIYSEELEDCDPRDLPRYVFDALDAFEEDEIEFLVAVEEAHDRAARASLSLGKDFLREWLLGVKKVVGEYRMSVMENGHETIDLYSWLDLNLSGDRFKRLSHMFNKFPKQEFTERLLISTANDCCYSITLLGLEGKVTLSSL